MLKLLIMGFAKPICLLGPLIAIYVVVYCSVYEFEPCLINGARRQKFCVALNMDVLLTGGLLEL
jgi:hypothetical protein